MAHALHLAWDIKDGGGDVKLIFCGRSVEWIPQLTNSDREQEHRFVQAYGNVFDSVRDQSAACNFCCTRFGVRDQVQAAGVPILGEGKDHMNLGALVLDGWQVITY